MVLVAYLARRMLHPVPTSLIFSPNQFLGEVSSSEINCGTLQKKNGAGSIIVARVVGL